MTPAQAKKVWESKYNIIVKIEEPMVKVVFLDDMTVELEFEFVPAFCGDPTAWFDASGSRLQSPGWLVRKAALAAARARAERERLWGAPGSGEESLTNREE
jgi:hypothetical protein